MTDDIPECPFCNSSRVAVRCSGSAWFVECDDCRATGPCITDGENDETAAAVAAWCIPSRAAARRDDKGQPTAQDIAAIDQAMLKAALHAFGSPPHDQMEQDEIARHVVAAMAAASNAESAEVKRLSHAIGRDVYHPTEVEQVVATAFWLWSEGIEMDIGEVSACSIAGSRMLGLAQGLVSATNMTQALDALAVGSEVFFSSEMGIQRAAAHASDVAMSER